MTNIKEQNRIREWQTIPNEARPKARYWMPGAAVDDEDLVQELQALKERGFGGVEIVGLLNTPEEVMGSSDGWGTKRWNEVLSLIDRTAGELGMSVDVANGPAWPISVPTVAGPDDPAALTELTWGVLDIGAQGRYAGALPARRTVREEGTARLLQVLAYQQDADGALKETSYRDLMDCVTCENNRKTPFHAPGAAEEDLPSGKAQEDGSGPERRVNASLPEADEGCTWLLFAFYMQPAAQTTGNGRYYVVDHASRAGVDACRRYWDAVLSEHPLPNMESFFCDSLEYNVALDWPRDLEQEFEARAGYSLLPYLPFISYSGSYPPPDVPGYRLDHAEISDMVQQDYCEVLTQLYCENHLAGLEEMAERYGKSVRYQVAYNKPYDEERSAMFVGIPENEGLGRPAMDGLKRMAAAAHLGRKRRYSFECAAEFGSGYGQNFEDLFWWVKRSLMSGMNAQVLHGASYSGGYHGDWSENGFMKGAEWPGYEAFGRAVSNNWNRTLSVEDERGCLDAIARLNALFLKTAKVDCLVYRSSYRNDGEDSEFAFFPDGGRLANAGYSYETISAQMLRHPNAVVSDGVLDPDGAAWRCLLIPPQETASLTMLREVRRLLDAGFPVIWFGEKPLHGQYLSECLTPDARKVWRAALDEVWEDPELIHAASIGEAVPLLERLGIRPRLALYEAVPAGHNNELAAASGDKAARVEGTAERTPNHSMDLTCAVHEDGEAGLAYYAVYGYNRVELAPELAAEHEEFLVSALYRRGTTKSSYQRPGEGSRRQIPVSLDRAGTVYRLDYWTGDVKPLAGFKETADGRMEGVISIEEDELVLLAVDEKIGMMDPMAHIPSATSLPAQRAGIPSSNSPSRIRLGVQAASRLHGVKEAEGDVIVPQAGTPGERTREMTLHFDTLELREFGPNAPGEKSFLRSGYGSAVKTYTLDALKPWRKIDPALEEFAGQGTYRGSFELDGVRDDRTYLLSLGDVCDTFRVWVNGKETAFPDQVLKRVDVTDLVHEGRNELEVLVTSNLYNRLLHAGGSHPEWPDPTLGVRDYGMWESEGKRCILTEIC